MRTETKRNQQNPSMPGMAGTQSTPAPLGMPELPAGMKIPEVIKIDGCDFMKGIPHEDPVSQVTGVRNMEVKADDVFLCAYPKAGTHWVWEILSMLRKGKAEYEPRSKVAMMMELMPYEELAAFPSPRVFNTHYLYRFLPYQIREKGARIIYVSRNPKDAAVSFYHHQTGLTEPMKFTGSFSEFLTKRVFAPPFGTDWFTYEQDWEKVFEVLPDLKVIHVVYEDLKKDLVSNVERLAEFLETGASKELCRQIAEACDFKKHKEADKNKARPAQLEKFMDNQFLQDSSLYRKGEVGDWKNWFTVAQSETFDQVYAEKMKNSKLTYKYSL